MVGHRWIGIAGANYAGQSAVGVAAGYQVTEHLSIGAGVSESKSSYTLSKVQAGFEW